MWSSQGPIATRVRLPRTSLTFEAKRGDVGPRIDGERFILSGETTWLVRGEPREIALLAERMDAFSLPLQDNLLELSFGNAVGVFALGSLGAVEVESGKWSHRHFDRMLDDIAHVSARLPFAGAARGSVPYERALLEKEEILYHTFIYLRHCLLGAGPPESRLMPALEAIVRDPQRRSIRVTARVPPELARHVNAAELERLAQGRAQMSRVTDPRALASPLARALQGHMPHYVNESQTSVTLDTPENRFIKAFLGMVANVVERVRIETRSRYLRRRRPVPNAFDRRVLDDCRAMQAVLEPIRRAGMWADVGPMVHFPVSSTVLQRRAGYREAYGHFVRMRSASQVPLRPADARQLLEVKDIALLYELWTFFQLVDAISAAAGRPVQAASPETGAWEESLGHSLVVSWPSGLRLAYNARFARGGGRLGQSYSVPLRPDMALWVPAGPNEGLHLLDAKFRLEWLMTGRDGPVKDEGEIEAEERLSTHKLADLYKMHTYRDAIDGARSVWILYPGTETRYFGVDGRSAVVDVTALPVRLNGVGAVPVRPESGGSAALEALAAILCGPARSD